MRVGVAFVRAEAFAVLDADAAAALGAPAAAAVEIFVQPVLLSQPRPLAVVTG
ncbi:MAG: hypothetical protein KY476_19830 [Planctomycetes bacterium]|nr:hypothetical protein [Planctomycetota bacterium]